MIIKTFILVLLLCLKTFTASAGDKYKVDLYKTNGDSISCIFSERIKVSYKSDSVLISTSNIEMSFPLNQLERLNISKSDNRDETNRWTLDLCDTDIVSLVNFNNIQPVNIRYKRPLKKDKWHSLILPFSFTYNDINDDIDILKIENFNIYNDSINKLEILCRRISENEIFDANTPYLIQSREDVELEINSPFTELQDTKTDTLIYTSVNGKAVKLSWVYKTEATEDNVLSLDDEKEEGISNKTTTRPFRWFIINHFVSTNQIKFSFKMQEDEPTYLKEIFLSDCQQSIYTIGGIKKEKTDDKGFYLIRNKNGVTFKIYKK